MRSALIVLALASAAGCATTREEVADPPIIDKLRLSITKTRNAIRETRETIARSAGSPLLPELYVRLAELLGEEARYHNQVAYEREERKSKLIHAPQVQLLKNQAIGVYRDVLARFPDTPLAPQIRFNIGHELRELGEFEPMVQVLEELVAKHPQSPLAGEALLVLGDYWFDKSELVPAGAKYAAITRRPLARVTSLAQYKLGWVYVNQGDCKAALTSFESALESSRIWADAKRPAPEAPKAPADDAPTTPTADPSARSATMEGGGGKDDEVPATAQAIDVRREALVDLVHCYTQERDVTGAVGYLRARASNRASYIAALRRMADRLSLIGRADAGLPVARELMRLAPGDTDRLDDARVLYAFLRHELKPEVAAGTTPPPGKTAAAQAKGERFLFRAEDVSLLTEAVLRWLQLPGATDEVRQSTREEFERYARDVLTIAQERAQALPTDRKAALLEVADGYRVYLDAFPAATERLAMLQNLSDALGLAEEHLDAGMVALDVAELAPDATARQTALFDAVSELQKALQAKGQAGVSEVSLAGRVVARAALRRAGIALLAGHAQSAEAGGAGALAVDRVRAVKFAVALTYFDEGRFREAIDRLTALAYEYPGTEEATTALFLALDAHDAAGDYDGLITLGHRFMAADSPASEDAKAKIAPAVARAEQRKLDELALAAAGTGGADLAELERFGQRFAGTKLGERALVNAFVAARAVGDNDAVQRLGQDIVSKYPGSEQVTGVISTMARNALASLDYDRAIQAFKQAASAQTGESVPLLLAAAEIQASLGDPAGAEALLEQALGAAKTPSSRQQIGQKLAVSLEERGASASEVLRVLTPLAADREARVLAAIGLAQVANGQGEEAEATFQGVLGGQMEALPDAKARAHLGSAEALARLIDGFALDGSLDGLNELTALIDLLEESYLTAARDGDPIVTPTALARLATNARMAAGKLRGAPLPGDLGDNDKNAIKRGLDARAKQLDELAEGAITTCAGQAWSAKIFNPAVRRCMTGQALSDARLLHDATKPRQRSGAAPVPEALRQKLTDNPESVEAIVAVGTALLDSGDPHTARLVLSRALASGGANAQNLLGIAHHQVGDHTAALEAFARAADAGLEAGRQNLRTALQALGLQDAAGEVDKRWPDEGEAGGRLIGGGGAGPSAGGAK